MDDQSLTAKPKVTGSYGKYGKQSFGKVTLDAPGNFNLRLEPAVGNWKPLNVRDVELKMK